MPEMLASGGGLTFKPGSIDAVVEALETLVASEQRRRLCAEQARNTPGVFHCTQGAAASMARVRLALLPNLHSEPNDLIAAPSHKSGRDGTVDPARHRD